MKFLCGILTLLGLICFTIGDGSWQGYVDDQLVGAGLSQAAIIGHDGNVWAISPGFEIRAGEGLRLVYLFGNPSEVFATGITVDGVKYLGIKADSQSIYGKKGSGGIVIVKTGSTVLIGIYDSTMQPGNAAIIVERLGDYLRDNGY